MASHNLFYFPYASLTNAQLPLFKVAALYFDKLTILDPTSAGWGTIGVEANARDAIELLKNAGIMQVVTPAATLDKYGELITDAIRADLADREFLELCEAHTIATGKDRWMLSLAKVPKQLQTDQAMRHLMGDFAREVAKSSGRFMENSGANPSQYYEYAEVGHTYDEYREGYGGGVEYRFANFPLAVGEAIMMNHALFTGLMHAGATPITDESFHSRALALKLKRAAQQPVVRQLISDLETQRRLKGGAVAWAAFRDPQISLPVLNPAMPLAEVLQYREDNRDALAETRDALASIARSIESEPWSDDFARKLESQALPALAARVKEATKARDSWLDKATTRTWLKVSGLAVGTATAIVTLIAAPVTPIALAALGLNVAGASAIPGAEWLLDRRKEKKARQENGLHYLLKI